MIKTVSQVSQIAVDQQKKVVTAVGKRSYEYLDDLYRFISFIGGTAHALIHAVCHPRSVRWKDAFACMVRCGQEGLAVTILICLLMGIILGYQSASQMQKYGANMLLPVLVGCSIVRE